MSRFFAILDSGAFSAKYLGKPIDLDEYIEFVKQNASYFEGGYFNLDVLDDGPISYRNWIEMRRQGLDPIPVYHVSTEGRWLQRYLRQTDYVAIGSLAGANQLNVKRTLYALKRVWQQNFLDDKGQAKCKVHGLGVTSSNMIYRFPW